MTEWTFHLPNLAAGLFAFGLLLDIVGVVLISTDLIGPTRFDRFEERLHLYLRNIATPLFTPAYLLQSFMDLFFRRRNSFWFFLLSPVLLLPWYAAWLYETVAAVRLYLLVLDILWKMMAAICLPLFLAAGILWLGLHARRYYPLWIDHLLSVAFWILRFGLVVSAPAVVLFLAVPIVFNFVFIKGLLYLLYAFTALVVHLPTFRDVRPSPLRLLGILCLTLGLTVQVVSAF